MQILLARQEHASADAFVTLADSQNMNCLVLGNGEDAFYTAGSMDVDMIVCETKLDDMSGLDLLRRVRLAQIATPFVFLTSTPNEQDEIKAYQLGANDYIKQPFNGNVLFAKLKSMVLHSKGNHFQIINVGDLQINISGSQVSHLGELIDFTAQQFHLLEALALNKNHVVSRSSLLNRMCNYASEPPDESTLNVQIHYIRRKIQRASGKNYIHLVRGMGYRLSEY